MKVYCLFYEDFDDSYYDHFDIYRHKEDAVKAMNIAAEEHLKNNKHLDVKYKSERTISLCWIEDEYDGYSEEPVLSMSWHIREVEVK